MLKMRITRVFPLKHTGEMSEFFISNLIITTWVNVGLQACPSAHACANPRAFVRGFTFVSLSYAQAPCDRSGYSRPLQLITTITGDHYYDYRSSVRGAEVLVHP